MEKRTDEDLGGVKGSKKEYTPELRLLSPNTTKKEETARKAWQKEGKDNQGSAHIRGTVTRRVQ